MSSKLTLFSALLLSMFSSMILASAHAAEQLYTDQPTVSPVLSKEGIWPVGVTTLEVVNPQQLSTVDFVSRTDRKLVLEVWYPAIGDDQANAAAYVDQTRSGKKFELLGRASRDATAAKTDKKFPLIVLSHGYTGYRSIMFYLGEHLASHGYIVAAIDHTDSRNQDIDFKSNAGAGFMSTLFNRSRDQQFTLDHLSAAGSPFAKVLDHDNAAVIGYSMGGYGAINTVGGCYGYTKQGMLSFGIPETAVESLRPLFNYCAAGKQTTDPRWKAMIALAPWGGEQNVHDPKALAKIAVPTLYIAGEIDDVSGYERGVKALFEATGSADNYMLVYENARHNIAAHPAPEIAYQDDFDMGHYYEPSWNSETINRINEHMSLAFLDCHVKEKQDACDMLPTRQDVVQTRQADGSLTPAWPGFPERWGAGLQFIRK